MKTKIRRRRMTMAEFYRVLERLRSAGWIASLEGSLPVFNPYIRLRPRNGRRCYCPITAAIWLERGRYVYPNRAEQAGIEMGLDHGAVVRIIHASDDASMHPRIRKRMARALNMRL